jgi:hypothetical protein
MAFNTANDSGSNNRNGNGNTGNDNWKATGFINIFLPSKEGGRVKLGAIPLKASRPREHELANWLHGTDLPKEMPEADREAELESRLGRVIDKIEIDYTSAEPSEGKGFDLT